MEHSKQKIKTFLMFDGKAEEAINYYLSVFDQAEILSIHRYGANEAGAPLTTYPFSEKFGWVADKYGVSWQLNLERN